MTYESTDNWDSCVDSHYVMKSASDVVGEYYGESDVPSAVNYEPAEHVPEFPNRPCHMMFDQGSCTFGNNCRYAHAEPAEHKPEFPKKVCNGWMAGTCTRGNFCKYAHSFNQNAVKSGVFHVVQKGGVNHVGQLSKRQKMKASAAVKASLRATVKVSRGATERPATLRELKAFVEKCLEENNFPAVNEFPANINAGLYYYNLPIPTAKYYPEVPFENLLDEIKNRLGKLKCNLLSVPSSDAMSTTSGASTRSWQPVTPANSAIQEELFNKKCKGGSGSNKATWSEQGSDSSMAGSAMSYNLADLNASGIQVLPRVDLKASTTVDVTRYRVVVAPAGVPLYSAPNWKGAKLGVAKFLSLVTVTECAGDWVKTENGWALERENASGAGCLVVPRARDLLRVKLPAGQCLAVRKAPRSKEIVGKLSNGDVIVALGRSGKLWIKHAEGWSVYSSNKRVFFEEINKRSVTTRRMFNGNTRAECAVCFSWLENRGECNKPDCMFSHQWPAKEVYTTGRRKGAPKMCHEQGNCKYARFPRACRFFHAKPASNPAKGFGPKVAVAKPAKKTLAKKTLVKKNLNLNLSPAGYPLNRFAL